MVMGVAIAGTIFTTSLAHLTQGAGLASYTPAMAPYFMASLQTGMVAGALMAFVGAAITFARGKDG